MGFSDPASAEVVAVTGDVTTQPGSVTETLTGSVTTNTQAEASAIDLAVIQGLLPAGVAYANARTRSSAIGVADVPASTTATLATADPNVQYIVKTVLISGQPVGLQYQIVGEYSPTGTFARYILLALADVQKAPLSHDYGMGLALRRGYSIKYVSPALAGTYDCHVVYDLITF